MFFRSQGKSVEFIKFFSFLQQEELIDFEHSSSSEYKSIPSNSTFLIKSSLEIKREKLWDLNRIRLRTGQSIKPLDKQVWGGRVSMMIVMLELLLKNSRPKNGNASDVIICVDPIRKKFK